MNLKSQHNVKQSYHSPELHVAGKKSDSPTIWTEQYGRSIIPALQSANNKQFKI